MAGNVLRSKRAVEVSVFVVRAFVQLRDLLATHKTLARQLSSLEPLGHIACCPGAEDTAEYMFITDQIKRFLVGLANAS